LTRDIKDENDLQHHVTWNIFLGRRFAAGLNKERNKNITEDVETEMAIN
jgi:hypothetical protein